MNELKLAFKRFRIISCSVAMASTHLERARALEEDLDQYEDACAELLTIEVKRVRSDFLNEF